MSAPMVRAILAGAKTQTRRIVKPQPFSNGYLTPGGLECWCDYYPPDAQIMPAGGALGYDVPCPYGAPGDRLWVRETWGHRGSLFTGGAPTCEHFIEYRADGVRINHRRPADDESGLPRQVCRCGDAEGEEQRHTDELVRFWAAWRPAIHMPRWASRITLAVEAVRVERLRDITEADARAEWCRGVRGPMGQSVPGPPTTAREAFERLWREINGDASWAANPWVWVISFRRVTP